jgi:hypothetical protein
MGLNQRIDLIGHLDLSGMWLSVDMRLDTKITRVEKEVKLRAQNMLTILNPTINKEHVDYIVR